MAARPRVLVVDDDDDIRRISMLRLRDTYDMLEATSGPEALERVFAGGIDLVLLDVMMPGMSGIDACRRLKAWATDQYLPVLLLTALDDQPSRNAGLEAGADDYLSKPLDAVKLRLRVGHLLKLRTQEQLIRTQVGQLTRLVAQRDDLTSLLVHDLRNPLVGVMGALQLMEMSDLAPADREMVALGLSSAERVCELTGDLLRVRTLEDGGLSPAREPVPLDEVISAALQSVNPAAKRAQVTLARHGTGPVARVDRKLLLRALENLLVNAIRHTRGSVDLTVSSDAAWVVLDVADRGPGIPDDLKPTLFQKYGTVEARASGGNRSGHGIGLYLVELVAKGHGGRVEVRDREAGGAVFRIVLPA